MESVLLNKNNLYFLDDAKVPLQYQGIVKPFLVTAKIKKKNFDI